MKIILQDKKGWERVIVIDKKVKSVIYPVISGETLVFELDDYDKKRKKFIFKELDEK